MTKDYLRSVKKKRARTLLPLIYRSLFRERLLSALRYASFIPRLSTTLNRAALAGHSSGAMMLMVQLYAYRHHFPPPSTTLSTPRTPHHAKWGK